VPCEPQESLPSIRIRAGHPDCNGVQRGNMKNIRIQFDLTPRVLERLDDAVRASHQRHEPVLQDMDRNALMRFALDLGLRQIEGCASLESWGPETSGVFTRPCAEVRDVRLQENPTLPPPRLRRVR
jgi:hypothetical protein